MQLKVSDICAETNRKENIMWAVSDRRIGKNSHFRENGMHYNARISLIWNKRIYVVKCFNSNNMVDHNTLSQIWFT